MNVDTSDVREMSDHERRKTRREAGLDHDRPDDQSDTERDG